jgi:putative Ca2+/H+ antiporter (TMEM165/GDT1 family)
VGLTFDVGAAVTAFALIFPAELPDKTFIATLVMATRLRPLPVWLGVSAAFVVQCVIAVAAGGLLSLLPHRWVAAMSASTFAVGAFILVKGGLEARAQALAEEQEEAAETESLLRQAGRDLSFGRTVATSFGVIFVAEWGDLSQLLTAALAARTGEPLAVGVGSWLALVAVAGLGVVIGRWLVERVPIHRVRLISGSALAVLAVLAVTEAVRG